MQRLLKIFSLKDWGVTINHNKLDLSTLAQTAVNREAREAVIELNKIWIDPISITELKKVALHEALELRLSRIESMVCGSKKEEAREEVHAIIMAITNMVYPDAV